MRLFLPATAILRDALGILIMKTYQHTQPATTVLFVMSVLVMAELILGIAQFRPLLAVAALFGVIGWMFRSLTIEITGGELIWRFGSGWLTKRVLLGEIASARVVRTSILEGWGIHYTRFGWLYNGAGFDAVAITLRNGKKFCLGTDDAENLAGRLTGR